MDGHGEPAEPGADVETPTSATVGFTVRPSLKRPALARGTIIGRYVILETLGQGGMGTVYTAYDPELDRRIALKLLTATRTSARAAVRARERLQREAQALARLSHPNVVAVHDVGIHDDDVFVAMELIEGETLNNWSRSHERSARQRLDVLVAAGRGLAAAHRAGLVHRDFKPDNVIVADDGRVCVLDFGLARDSTSLTPDPESSDPGAEPSPEPSPTGDTAPPTQDDELATKTSEPLGGLASISSEHKTPGRWLGTPLTVAGTVMGTPAYMAPEQHLGEPADEYADQFSFCVTLYVALYGEHPFGDNSTEIHRRVLAGQVRPPGPKARPVPARLRRILVRGMAPAKAARFRSMEALLGELARDPRAMARRGAVVLGFAGVLGFAAFATFHQRATTTELCRGAGAKLAGVWDLSRRQAVQAAFRATHKPYADDAFRGAARALDGYAGSWIAMQTETCEATRVRGEQSEARMDLRTGCLARRLVELQAQVELFARADVAVVERAVHAAQSLKSLDSCADVGALEAAVRPPDDLTVRAKVEDQRRRLATATALKEAGKYGDASPIVMGVVGAARPLGYRPLEAEALLLAGELQDLRGDPASAQHTLDDALIAATAGRHHEVEAETWTALAEVVGTSLAHPDAGHGYARHGFAAVEGLGGNDLVLARLHKVVGTLLDAEGKHADAIAEYLKGLAIFERVLGPDHPQVASALAYLGISYHRQGNRDQARASYERSLAIAERVLGSDHPDVADALNHLGNLAADRGEYARAQRYYERSLAIRERSLADRPEHPDIASSLHNLGTACQQQGRLDQARGYYERAAAMLEHTFGPDHPRLATTLNNLGSLFEALGDHARARTLLERALAIRERALGPAHELVGSTLDNLGQLYVAQQRYDLARVVYERTLAIWEAALGVDHPDLALVLLGLARVQLGVHHPAGAIAPLERALAIRRARPGAPTELAAIQFVLAQALTGAGRDPARAVELAGEARRSFAAAAATSELAEVERWIATRR